MWKTCMVFTQSHIVNCCKPNRFPLMNDALRLAYNEISKLGIQKKECMVCHVCSRVLALLAQWIPPWSSVMLFKI